MATRRTTTRTYTSKAWMFTLSFWLVVIIGAAMALVAIMHLLGVHAFDSAAGFIKHICFLIGMFIPVVMSYQVAKYKGTLWFVLWIIFVILVVFGIIAALF